MLIYKFKLSSHITLEKCVVFRLSTFGENSQKKNEEVMRCDDGDVQFSNRIHFVATFWPHRIEIHGDEKMSCHQSFSF